MALRPVELQLSLDESGAVPANLVTTCSCLSWGVPAVMSDGVLKGGKQRETPEIHRGIAKKRSRSGAIRTDSQKARDRLPVSGQWWGKQRRAAQNLASSPVNMFSAMKFKGFSCHAPSRKTTSKTVIFGTLENGDLRATVRSPEYHHDHAVGEGTAWRLPKYI
jgi:hypothetical protein